MPLTVPRILVLTVLAGLLLACSREVERPGAELLQHVPADTAYLFVNSRPLPDDLRTRLGDQYAAQLSAQRATFASVREQLEAADESAPLARRAFAVVDALLAEFEGRDTAAAMRELGIEPVPRTLFYGIGLLPALRVEIADAARVNAMFDRVERRAGVGASRADLNGQAYRRIDLGPIDAVLAVTEGYAIAGLLPDALFGRDLPLLLGQQPPRDTLAAGDPVGNLIERHGFTGYGEGFVEIEQLAATLMGKGKGRNAETMHVLDASPLPVSDGCVRMVGELLGGMPRLVIGITRAERGVLAARGIWESTPAVADYLQRLAAPVPGVGGAYDGLLAFGIGLDLPQLRNAIEALLHQLMAAGDGCDWVDPAQLQAVIPSLNLALGPMTAGIRGFNLVIEDLVIGHDGLQPSAVRGGLLAAVDDPRGVFALGAMFSPALAAVRIPNDGTFVDLPRDLELEVQAPPMKVAIRDKALLLVAGQGSAALADTLLHAAPLSPAPLLAFDYGVHQLVERLGGAMERVAVGLDSQGDADAAQGLRDQLASFRLQAELFDRLRLSLYASDKGLVIDQVMELRD